MDDDFSHMMISEKSKFECLVRSTKQKLIHKLREENPCYGKNSFQRVELNFRALKMLLILPKLKYS